QQVPTVAKRRHPCELALRLSDRFAPSRYVSATHSLLPSCAADPDSGNRKRLTPLLSVGIEGMAERVGFEPTLPFRVNTLSKRAPSATRPSLRIFVEGVLQVSTFILPLENGETPA